MNSIICFKDKVKESEGGGFMVIYKSTNLSFEESLDINKLRILDYILGKMREETPLRYENKVYEISFKDSSTILNLKEQYSKDIVIDFVKSNTIKPIFFKDIKIFEHLSYWSSRDYKEKESYIEIECKFTDEFFELLTKKLVFCYDIKNKTNLNTSLSFIFYDYLKAALRNSKKKETFLRLPLDYLKGFTPRHTPAYLKIQLKTAISLINKYTDIEVKTIKDIKIGNRLVEFYLIIKEKENFREILHESTQTCSL